MRKRLISGVLPSSDPVAYPKDQQMVDQPAKPPQWEHCRLWCDASAAESIVEDPAGYVRMVRSRIGIDYLVNHKKESRYAWNGSSWRSDGSKTFQGSDGFLTKAIASTRRVVFSVTSTGGQVWNTKAHGDIVVDADGTYLYVYANPAAGEREYLRFPFGLTDQLVDLVLTVDTSRPIGERLRLYLNGVDVTRSGVGNLTATVIGEHLPDSFSPACLTQVAAWDVVLSANEVLTLHRYGAIPPLTDVVPVSGLTIAPELNLVAGAQCSIVSQNLVLDRSDWGAPVMGLDAGSIPCTNDGGVWALSPTKGNIGDHHLVVTATRAGMTETAAITAHVVAALDRKAPLRHVLNIGDSGVADGVYTGQLHALLRGKVIMVGTQGSEPAKHEGYGGWTWDTFATSAESPLRRNGTLDIPHYLARLSAPPDIIIWELGANDIFMEGPATVDTRITADLVHAKTLMAAFDAELPNVVHLILCPVLGTTSQVAWDWDYNKISASVPVDDRFFYRRKAHQLAKRYIETYGHQGANRRWVLQDYLSLVDADYTNALHLKASGKAKIANLLHQWLTAHWRHSLAHLGAGDIPRLSIADSIKIPRISR